MDAFRKRYHTIARTARDSIPSGTPDTGTPDLDDKE